MKPMYLLMLLCVSLVNAAAVEGYVGEEDLRPAVNDENNEDDVGDEELLPAVNDENNEDDVEDEGTASDELAVNLRNGTGCFPRTSCQDAEGTCKPMCNEATESEVTDGCAGNGCKCCVNSSLRGDLCRRLCSLLNGNCKQKSCGPNAVPINFGCSFISSCICCVPQNKFPANGLGSK